MTSAGQLRSFVERIERIEEEIKASNDDKRDIYAEAKSNGFDVHALKSVIARRRKDPDKVAEHDSIVELYLSTLGMEDAPHARTREPKRRMERSAFQEPKVAPIGDVKQAYREGRPIGGDVQFQNAHVYFAACDATDRLKIGVSNNVDGRLSHIGQASGLPLRLVDALPGNRQEELRAHEAFERWRLSGEWFRYDADCQKFLQEYLARARTTPPAPSTSTVTISAAKLAEMKSSGLMHDTAKPVEMPDIPPALDRRTWVQA